MKSRILIVLLFALSSCGSPEYEKAIADWLQTDENGTWTDLKFELIELLDEKDVTVSDSLLYLDSKAAQQVQMIERAENPRALVKPLFSDYAKAKDNLKWIEKKKMEYKDRDSTEVLAKLLKCKYAIVPPSLKARQERVSDLLLWKQINLGLLMATAIAMILIAEKISRKKNIRACLLYIHMDLNLKYIKMMKKIKLHLFALCATLVLVSCGGSDNDPVFNNTSAVYKVVLEASGDDYTAEAIIINPDNVSIIDETSNTDLKQSSVTEYFSGRKVYITSKEVKVISAQGIILSKSKSGAILKMTVYQDGKEVYQNTVSVPDSENNTKSIQYTNIKN